MNGFRSGSRLRETYSIVCLCRWSTSRPRFGHDASFFGDEGLRKRATLRSLPALQARVVAQIMRAARLLTMTDQCH